MSTDCASTQDAGIESGTGTTNYGARSDIPSGHNYYATGDERSLIQFDLSGIPSGSTITAASLIINVLNCYTTITHEVRGITAAWSEGTVTWNNQPTNDSTQWATLSISTTGSKTFDVKTLVQAWLTGALTNNGLLIKGVSEGLAGLQGIALSSKEDATSGNRPIIRVTYTPPAGGGFLLHFI